MGTGTGTVFQSKTGVTLNFRSLAALAGSHLVISNDGDNNEVDFTTDATSSNTASTLVARNASGNFAAGTITANLIGNVTGAASLNVLKAGDTMTGNLTMATQNAVRFQDSSASANFVGLNAPAAVTASYTVNLPASAPVAGQVLQATSPTATQWANIGGIPANAQAYYVSKAGSDVTGNGSFVSPYLTLAHALTVAQTTPVNPTVIYVGAGIFIETNPVNGMPITQPGISIVGSSMTSTTIMPANTANDLFGVSTPNVNFYDLTMDTGSATPTFANAVTYSVSTTGQAGFHAVGITGFNKGLSITGTGGSPLVICDALQAQGNTVSIAVNNVHTIIENSVFVGPYTGSVVSNTAITIDGSQTSGTLVNVLNNSFTLLATGVGVSQTISGSNMRMLGCNIDNTNVGVNCAGACTATIVGCDFILNNSGSINIQASGVGTNITINGCNFDGATTVGSSAGYRDSIITRSFNPGRFMYY